MTPEEIEDKISVLALTNPFVTYLEKLINKGCDERLSCYCVIIALAEREENLCDAYKKLIDAAIEDKKYWANKIEEWEKIAKEAIALASSINEKRSSFSLARLS